MSRYPFPPGFIARFVSIARGQVGVREVGTNGGAAVRAFQSMTWMEPGPWPWCAAFVCWVYAGAAVGDDAFLIRPDTPRAYGFESWGRKHAELIREPDALAIGDIVCFRFSHVGIVVEPCCPESVWTVEGNTDSTGGRNGDGVYMRRRNIHSIRSAIRLHESNPKNS